MKKQLLGTDLVVSAMGYGCMGLSHAYGPAVPRKDAVDAIHSAYDAGYTYFDTAECYTGSYADGSPANNEEVVGEAIRPFRDKVILASKFGVKHGGDHLIMDSSPAAIRRSIDGSLKRLGVDHIDLYYQHRIDPKVSPEEVADTMKELMQEGKITHWGISEATEEYLRRANAVCKVTAIQNRYSMMARWYESLFPVCEELQVGYVAFSPLANGFLSGAFAKGSTFADGDFRNSMPQYSDEGQEKNRVLISLLSQLSAEKQATPAQISLAWMICKKPFIVPIPGSRKKDRIAENAGAADILLTAEEIRNIDNLLDETGMSDVFGGHSAE